MDTTNGSPFPESPLDNFAEDNYTPEACVCNNPLVLDVIENGTAEEMENRMKLSPKIRVVLVLSVEIINRSPIETKTYLSTVSVASNKEEHVHNYAMVFLNSQTPGMLPQRINLKVGTTVMPLRNISRSHLCNRTPLQDFKIIAFKCHL